VAAVPNGDPFGLRFKFARILARTYDTGKDQKPRQNTRRSTSWILIATSG